MKQSNYYFRILVFFLTIFTITSCKIEPLDIGKDMSEYSVPAEGTKGVLTLNGDTIHYVFTDGKYFLGEDVYLEPIQFNKIVALKDSIKNARGLTISDMGMRWSGSKIPYTIKSGFLDTNSRLQTAINMINSETSLQLVPRNGERDFVEFRSVGGTTSSSLLGRVGFRWFPDEGFFTGKQYISISNGAGFGTIIHEIFHAAGLMHEHQRSDANQHIEINFNNIVPEKRPQFETRLNGRNVGPFNVNSIMNYGSMHNSSVAINPDSAVIRRRLPNNTLIRYRANRDSITHTDIYALNLLYGPRDTRALKRTSTQTINEAFTDQYIDIYDETTHYTVTFHQTPSSTALYPTENFMLLKIHYYLRTHGQGPDNLASEYRIAEHIIKPGTSQFSFDFRYRYETGWGGYHLPSTYMEELIKIETESIW